MKAKIRSAILAGRFMEADELIDGLEAELKEARVQFKKWQEKAEATAKDFEQRNMTDSQLTSEAMAMAYKFCFDFLNKQDQEE